MAGLSENEKKEDEVEDQPCFTRTTCMKEYTSNRPIANSHVLANCVCAIYQPKPQKRVTNQASTTESPNRANVKWWRQKQGRVKIEDTRYQANNERATPRIGELQCVATGGAFFRKWISTSTCAVTWCSIHA